MKVKRFSAKCDDKNLQIGNRVIGSLKRFQECQEIDNIYVLEDECEDNAVSRDENTAEGDLPCLARKGKQRYRKRYRMTGH
jgi:hypothetical protein